MAYAADSTSFNPTAVSVKAAPGGGGVPVGTVVAWPVASNPSDADYWLECNGQSTIGYPELAAVVGVKVPDLRGKFLRGLGGNSAGLGAAQGDAIRNITGSEGVAQGVVGNAPTGAFKQGVATGWMVESYSRTAYMLAFDASRVVPTANENRPVNMAVRYLIRARP